MTRKKRKEEHTFSSGLVIFDGVLIDKDDYPFTDDSSSAFSDPPSDHNSELLDSSEELRNVDGEREEQSEQILKDEREEVISNRGTLTVETTPFSSTGAARTNFSAADFRLSPPTNRRAREDDELLTRSRGLPASRTLTHQVSLSTSPSGSLIHSPAFLREDRILREDTEVLRNLRRQDLDLFPAERVATSSSSAATLLQHSHSSASTSHPSHSLLRRPASTRSASKEARRVAQLLFPEASRFTPASPPSRSLLLTNRQSHKKQWLPPQTRKTVSPSPSPRPLPLAARTPVDSQNRDSLYDSYDTDLLEMETLISDADGRTHANTSRHPSPLPVVSSMFDSSSNVSLHRASPIPGSSRTRHSPTASTSNALSSQKSRNPNPEPDNLSSYKCPVCLSPPINATMTLCGHVACGECLFTAVRSDIQRQQRTFSRDTVHPRCPVCRGVLKGWDGRGGGVIGLQPMIVIVVS